MKGHLRKKVFAIGAVRGPHAFDSCWHNNIANSRNMQPRLTSKDLDFYYAVGRLVCYLNKPGYLKLLSGCPCSHIIRAFTSGQ